MLGNALASPSNWVVLWEWSGASPRLPSGAPPSPSYNSISRNEHSLKCSGSVTIAGESREGLASILSSRCSICHHTIIFATAEKVKGPHGYSRWECILAAVWGQMTTGGGHSHLEDCSWCPCYDEALLRSV